MDKKQKMWVVIGLIVLVLFLMNQGKKTVWDPNNPDYCALDGIACGGPYVCLNNAECTPRCTSYSKDSCLCSYTIDVYGFHRSCQSKDFVEKMQQDFDKTHIDVNIRDSVSLNQWIDKMNTKAGKMGLTRERWEKINELEKCIVAYVGSKLEATKVCKQQLGFTGFWGPEVAGYHLECVKGECKKVVGMVGGDTCSPEGSSCSISGGGTTSNDNGLLGKDLTAWISEDSIIAKVPNWIVLIGGIFILMMVFNFINKKK